MKGLMAKITKTRAEKMLGFANFKKLLKEGKIRPVGTGWGGTKMYDFSEVYKIAGQLVKKQIEL